MRKISASKLRKIFLGFFKKRDHKVVKSSSLVPADPTSLFTSAGMQQFVPYLSGEAEPPWRRAASVQKCLRVDDIQEVGDATHHTFFEMLGNWSFGDYFKKKAIDFALEFLLGELEIPKKRLWISIFEGKGEIPRDEEAERTWREKGIPKERIFEYGEKDNFWGPVTSVGPCGPCSEIFFDRTGEPCGKSCHPNCDCGRFTEIWNLVFMEFDKTKEGKFEKLKNQNVDTGLGFERMVALLAEKPSVYETELFAPVVREAEKLSGKKYEEEKRKFRVLADHARAISFIRGAGVLPSNTGRGHVLRRILRRFFRMSYDLKIKPGTYKPLFLRAAEIYGGEYPEVKEVEEIFGMTREEEKKYGRALKRGLKEFNRLISEKKEKVISGKEAFDLYQSYGFPLELTEELAEEKGFKVKKEEYEKAVRKHKEKSRKGAEKKFGGVGIESLADPDRIKEATRLHTATHLLQAGLRAVLGNHVKQMGSDITPERLRFDFSHPKELTEEEIEKVEDWVNERIEEEIPVTREKMPYKKAIESDALAFFKARYPKEVFVYRVGDVSKEICAGPHVENTGELGKFKITKEESAGAGIRRLKAVLK